MSGLLFGTYCDRGTWIVIVIFVHVEITSFWQALFSNHFGMEDSFTNVSCKFSCKWHQVDQIQFLFFGKRFKLEGHLLKIISESMSAWGARVYISLEKTLALITMFMHWPKWGWKLLCKNYFFNFNGTRQVRWFVSRQILSDTALVMARRCAPHVMRNSTAFAYVGSDFPAYGQLVAISSRLATRDLSSMFSWVSIASHSGLHWLGQMILRFFCNLIDVRIPWAAKGFLCMLWAISITVSIRLFRHSKLIASRLKNLQC